MRRPGGGVKATAEPGVIYRTVAAHFEQNRQSQKRRLQKKKTRHCWFVANERPLFQLLVGDFRRSRPRKSNDTWRPPGRTLPAEAWRAPKGEGVTKILREVPCESLAGCGVLWVHNGWPRGLGPDQLF